MQVIAQSSAAFYVDQLTEAIIMGVGGICPGGWGQHCTFAGAAN